MKIGWNEEMCRLYGGSRTDTCGRMFDANGQEVDEDVIWANLKTGVYVVRETLPDGKYLFTPDGKDLMNDIRHRPAPLIYVPK